MNYKLTFRVKGDHIAPDFVATETYSASSLDELAINAWEPYRRALHFIWKDMESGVFMDVRPNSLMSIECDNADEMDILNAFYAIRMQRVKKMVEIFHRSLK